LLSDTGFEMWRRVEVGGWQEVLMRG
jgi:hypothetical protein